MAPQKLGQHFLEDSTVISAIIDAADLSSSDTVVEVGPGRGALTGDLVGRAGRVLLLEYDTNLADQAKRLYSERYSRKRYRDKMVAMLEALD